MLKQGVAKHLPAVIEAHKHFQVAAKAHRGRLYGNAQRPLMAVLRLVNDEHRFLAAHVLTNGVSSDNG